MESLPFCSGFILILIWEWNNFIILRMRSYDCRGQHFKNIHSLAPATAVLAAVQKEVLIEWIRKRLKLDYQSTYSVVMVSRTVSCLNSLALGSWSRLA